MDGESGDDEIYGLTSGWGGESTSVLQSLKWQLIGMS